MSELRDLRIVRRSLAWLWLSAALSATAGAQTAADYRDQLDRLEPEWRAARAAVDAGERVRRMAARSVVVNYGSLRIIADSAIAHFVDDAAAFAWPTIDAAFGENARLLADHPVIVRRVEAFRGTDTAYTIRVRAGGREQAVTLDDSAQTRMQLVAALQGSAVVEPLHAALDETMRSWFGSPLPAGAESASELEDVYVELATASTTISRRCLAGDVLGCRQLLGLSPIPDPLLDGHTASHRRVIVAASSAQLRTPGNATEFDRCVAQHDDAACVRRLRDLPGEALLASVSSGNARRSFARSVLREGGEGAYSRLAASHTSPLDARFAAAGLLPADSLVASWRAHVLAARPVRPYVDPATALATLMWIAACGALSLRSSRWR